MNAFGLIGYPLGHSFSVSYFADKFIKEKITDSEYLNYPIKTIEEFPALIENNANLVGLNVTIPYKEKIIPYLNFIDKTAERIGAVNTVKIDYSSGKRILSGYNTDAPGFTEALIPFLSKEIRAALILGTGGASKAIKFALEKLGIEAKTVSRSISKANITYDNLGENIIRENLLIINSSPLGTFPDIDKYPDIPYNLLTDKHILFDLVYNPNVTLFMKKGTEMGAKTLNGYQMLVNQAEESWKIWNS